jgi:hypothetical protein
LDDVLVILPTPLAVAHYTHVTSFVGLDLPTYDALPDMRFSRLNPLELTGSGPTPLL